MRRAVTTLVSTGLLIAVALGVSAIIYAFVQSHTPHPGEGNPPPNFPPLVAVEARYEKVRGLNITISNPTAVDLSNYTVRILLDSSNFTDWDKLGAGVFFTRDPQATQPLYFWSEVIDTSTQTMVLWVKVPEIPASGSTSIYLWYGGRTPLLPQYNDPTRVFIYYNPGQANLFDAYPAGVSSYLGDFPNAWTSANGVILHTQQISQTVERAIRVLSKANLCVTSRINPLSLEQIETAGVVFRYNPANRNTYTMYLIYHPNAGRVGVELAKYTGSWSVPRSHNFALSDNAWYKLEACMYNNRVYYRVWQGPILIAQGTWTDPSPLPSGYFGLRAGWKPAGVTHAFDDIVAREFIAPEPSATVSGGLGDNVFVEVHLRNLGSRTVVVDQVYVKDLSGDTVITSFNITPTIIPVEGTALLTSLLPVENPGEDKALILAGEKGPVVLIKLG